MFKIDRETKRSEAVMEVEFSDLGLWERHDIQEWIAANPSILGEDLLITSKEFSDFDRTKERLDLLAVDKRGSLVIVELKRDDSGVDVHWQAIKYASYLQRANERQIVEIFARHIGRSEDDAKQELEKHLGTENLTILNTEQRIILASHRFALEVTSAALWLNEQANRGLITCVQLKPYQDANEKALYLQATTIIPLPGTESYRIGIGPMREDDGAGRSGMTSQGPDRQMQYDQVKRFFAKVEERAGSALSPELRPDKRCRYGRWRYTHMWYSREPWNNWLLCYRVGLDSSLQVANIGLLYDNRELGSAERAALEYMQDRRVLGEDQKNDAPWQSEPHYMQLTIGRHGKSLDDDFVDVVAKALVHVIETATPRIGGLFQDPEDTESP